MSLILHRKEFLKQDEIIKYKADEILLIQIKNLSSSGIIRIMTSMSGL